MSGNTLSAYGTQPNHGNLVNFPGHSTANVKLTVTSGTFTGNTDTSDIAGYEPTPSEDMPVVGGTATPAEKDEPAGPLPQQAQPTDEQKRELPDLVAQPQNSRPRERLAGALPRARRRARGDAHPQPAPAISSTSSAPGSNA
jgi:hypothetical protein